MRTFVALNLTAEARRAVYEATASLRAAIPAGVAWVREPSLHVTLKFLGDREPAFVDALVQSLRDGLRGCRPAEVRLGGIGAFPALDRPRVLWLGVASNPGLARLYQEVEAASAALNVPREQRRFHPHVTLGRVRAASRIDADVLRREAGEVGFSAVETVRTLDVMESALGPGGARYRVVAAIPVGDAEEKI